MHDILDHPERPPVRVIAELCLLIVCASLCVAQRAGSGTVEIRKVKIGADGNRMKIEFLLTQPVNSNLTIATNPDRLILDLHNTTNRTKQQIIAVNRNGVKQVRLALNTTSPLVTRAVIDLDGAHECKLATVGNTVILTVLMQAASGNRVVDARSTSRGSLWGKVWPRKSTAQREKVKSQADDSPAVITDSNLHVSFKVKYVAEGAAYLRGGRSSGLAEGMELVVRESAGPSSSSAAPPGAVVAELQIVSVAETSAVTEIHNPTRELKPGDWAELSAKDYARLGEAPANHAAKSPALPVAAVQQGKIEHLEDVSREASRISARIGFDYSGVSSSGSTPGRSSTVGMSFRTDATRIAGTYWNLKGYWRGRLTTNSQPDEDTLQDYLDRTYTIQLSYDNPNSKWVAGFGRLYLPWAVSLDTIDGGYVGRKVATGVTAGVFFGSTPDPASWHYRPDQQIGGSFVNFEGGDYDAFHYTSTAGVALGMVKWQLDRPYLFLENGLSFRKYISVYHSFIVDSPQGVSTDGIKPGTGISRSYLTVRIQPEQWISCDVSHNYFRDVPTAATALIATGLVDKLLYQGVNAGVRIEPVRNFAVYMSLGQSDKTGDAKRSLNQMYGVSWNEIWRTGIRADVHYSKFASSFARGDYRVITLSRHLGNGTIWDAQVGSQSINSALTLNQRSVFVDTSLDTNFGRHMFLQSGYTLEHGSQLNYSQWQLSLGYRFEAKGPVK